MSLKKASDRKLERLLRDELAIKREIAKAEVFASGVKTEFWKAIEEKFKIDQDRIEMDLDKFEENDDRKNTILLAKRFAIKGFLGIKDYAKSKQVFENALLRKQTEISDYRDRLKSQRE